MAVKLVTQGWQALTLNSSFRVRGLPIEREVPSLTVEGRDGEYVHEKQIRVRPRTISVSGYVYANSKEEALNQLDQLQGILNKSGTLKLYEDGEKDRYINVRYSNMAHDYEEGTNRKAARVTITFVAHDPHFYGNEQTIEHVVSPDTVRVEAESPGDFDVRFVGDWGISTSVGHSGQGTRHSRTPGDYVTFDFYGTGVSWIGAGGSGVRKADVYIDGSFVETVNVGSAGAQSVLFSSTGLVSGKHELKIVIAEGTTNAVHVDAFDIIGSNVLTIDNPGTADVEPVVFLQSQERERTHTSLGKVRGDNLPLSVHGFYGTNGLPSAPITGNEFSDVAYGMIATLDRVATNFNGVTSTAGRIAGHQFSLSLSDTLGGVLDRIRQHTKLHGTWWGRAQGVNGEAVNYESEVYAWNRITSQYDKLAEGGARFERSGTAINPDTGEEVAENVPRFVGGNYSLDGGKGYVTIPHSPVFNELNQFTLEAWVYNRGQEQVLSRVISRWGSAGVGARVFQISIQANGNILFEYGSENGQASVSTAISGLVPVGTWTHIAAVHTGDRAEIWVNGERKSVGEGTFVNKGVDQPIYISGGGSSTPQPVYLFNGLIDEVRIWNVARTPAQIAETMNERITKAPGLIARWGFDEGFGTTAHDTAERINLLPPNVANGGEDGTTDGFTTTSAVSTSSADEAWQGSRSIKVVTESGVSTSGVRATPIPVKAGKSYVSSVYVKGDAGKYVRLRRQLLDANNVITDNPGALEELTGDWQRIERPFVPGANHTSVRLIVETGSAQDTFTFYVDGLQLQEGEVATPWVMPKTEPYNGTISGATYDQDNPFFEQGGFGHGLLVEEGTTNLVPVDKLKFEGWQEVNGATVTVEQGHTIPELGITDATRITSAGGTGTTRYRYTIGSSDVADYTASVYIKNIGTTGVRLSANFGVYDGVSPGEVKRATIRFTGNGSTLISPAFLADGEGLGFDIIAWGPQIEAKPYATTFTTGTRAPESLRIPTPGVLNAERGQIDVDKVTPLNVNTWRSIFNALDSVGVKPFNLQFNPEGTLYLLYRSTSGSVVQRGTSYVLDDEKPHRYTLSYNGSNVEVYVDGVMVLERSDVETLSGTGPMYLGRGGLTVYGTHTYYGFRVLSEPMSDADIAAEYGKPLSANVHTTCLIDFNRNLASIMPVPFELANASDYVDDEGKVHILTRPKYPSDGTTPAEVATDYVELRTAQEYVSKPKITNKGKNLLVNPGFERLDGSGWVEGWKRSSNRVQLNHVETVDGVASVVTRARLASITQTVENVTPGAFYCLSAWVKAIGGSPQGVYIQLNQFDVNGGLIRAPHSRGLNKVNVWERVGHVWQADERCHSLQVLLSYDDQSVRDVFWDNIQLEQVDGPNDGPTEWEDSEAQIVEVDTDLVAGDVLRLDAEERRVSVNGENALSLANTQYKVHGLKLKPGKNTLVFEEDGGGAGLYKATIKYQPKNF